MEELCELRRCQSLKRSRKTFLSNLLTLVFGTASRNTTASGSQNFATRGRRKSRMSAAVRLLQCSGLGTTHASGRSTHVECGTAITAPRGRQAALRQVKRESRLRDRCTASLLLVQIWPLRH